MLRPSIPKNILNRLIICPADQPDCCLTVDSQNSLAPNLSPNKLQICIPSSYKAYIFKKSIRFFGFINPNPYICIIKPFPYL